MIIPLIQCFFKLCFPYTLIYQVYSNLTSRIEDALGTPTSNIYFISRESVEDADKYYDYVVNVLNKKQDMSIVCCDLDNNIVNAENNEEINKDKLPSSKIHGLLKELNKQNPNVTGGYDTNSSKIVLH